MISRRALLAGGAFALAGSLPPSRTTRAAEKPFLPQGLADGVYDTATLEALPGKKPLIKLTERPPNYETPLSHFTSEFTPNESFFVRYHLAGIPDAIDAAQWRLKVAGDGVAKPLQLSLSELRSDFAAAEIAAVCQCSGNRRGFSQPHVAGVQWGLGAVGNARWKGARLKDVLSRADLRTDAVEIVVNGADRPALDGTPDFIKSIPLAKALDDNTLIAYEMNGAPLPHLNGFPIRLIVPGWTATYWMKHVTRLEPRLKPLDNFWMKSAYRVPARLFPSTQRFTSQEAPTNTPITEIMVNSLFTSYVRRTQPNSDVKVKGIAWDGGYGIASVELSVDGGNTWRSAKLDDDLGRYSFRGWEARLAGLPGGEIEVLAKATNAIGQSQPMTPIANPAGYHHNAVARLTLDIT